MKAAGGEHVRQNLYVKVFIKDVSVPVTIFNEQIKYLVPEDEKITPNESVI